MKAKVIKTGEIVNVAPMGYGWITEDAQRQTFTESQLDFEYQEWDAFRKEAAKDILCAFASNEHIELSKDNIEKSVESSIALADILIIKLKGDGKE